MSKMGNNTIKYIGFYDILRDGEKIRSYSLAAVRKMDFICDTIVEAGYKVEIISPAHIDKMGNAYYIEENTQIRSGVNLRLPGSWEANSKIKRVMRVLKARAWLLCILLTETNKDDKIIVYHNYNFAVPILIAKCIKRFRIILEVEEIYSEVWHLSWYNRLKERMMLRYMNDDSLFVSEVLRDKVGIEKGIISYGSYNFIKDKSNRSVAHNQVKLVFSGLIDKERGSGFTAVRCMRYLPASYILQISGPVAHKNKKEFFREIDLINHELGRAACIYLGILDDKQYKDLLLDSDIALNPQFDGKFCDFVFPSKILTYMSCGLPIVSTRGESIVRSKVADLIDFADDYTPESVAKAILGVRRDVSDREKERLELLRMRFCEEIKSILSKEI